MSRPLSTRDKLRQGICPDCGTTGARHFVHAETCPLFTSVMRSADEDEAWFEAHPGQGKRRRPTTSAERDELRLMRRPADQYAIITRPAPGMHDRLMEPSGLRMTLVIG